MRRRRRRRSAGNNVVLQGSYSCCGFKTRRGKWDRCANVTDGGEARASEGQEAH